MRTGLSGFILVLDDDKDTVSTMTGFLRSQGFDVHPFTDPALALEDIKQNYKDCVFILSDIRMPSMNGFEFVKKARKIKPDLNVVFLTAFEISVSEFEQIHPSMKVSGLIKKPVLMRKLMALINNTLDAKMTIRNDEGKEIVSKYLSPTRSSDVAR